MPLSDLPASGVQPQPAFRIAHLSDPHLAPLPHATVGQLASKRILGFLSWTLRRKHIHLTRALDAVCADIKRGGFDHIALTGDVANISLPAEFDHGAQFLSELGAPTDVTLVPGNHDAYIAVDWNQAWHKWLAYMTGDDGSVPSSPDSFPFLRRRGPVAIVALNTGEPEAWFMATGSLGAQQIARAEAMLRAAASEGLFRLVLIHHPPQPGGAPRRKRLIDAPEFRAMLGRVGAELVIHGHMHRPMLGRIDGPQGPVPVLGAASASTDVSSHYGAGGYQALSIARDPSGWTVDVEIRQIAADYAGCRAINRFRFVLPSAR